MKVPRTGVLCAALFLAGGIRGAPAQEPEVLGAEAWRADLQQLHRAILTTHPRPFQRVEEEALEAAVERLSAEIPGLSDHAIMLRMSRIAGLLRDGHTRLSLPRAPPDLAFSYAHSADPEPSDPRLRLGQLPVDLAALADGLFVARAAAGFGEHVGSRVAAFGDVPAAAALEGAGALVSAENPGGRRMLGADLLESPDALAHLGVASRACGVPVRLERPSGSPVEACWPALAADRPAARREDRPAYRVTRRPADGLVVLELNEITTTRERPVGETVAEAVRAAEADDARLAIDLRRNTGGSNAYGRAVVLAVARSAEMNAYGRTFALIGPRTFSAAQVLLNELERYTRVLFVGEPSGSHPDHYGDARKIRLDRSGLTLRVSTLHWSSGTAGDRRDATRPHLPVPRTSDAVFGGRDPALVAAAEFRFPGLAELMASQLVAGSPYNAAHVGYLDVVSGGPTIPARRYLRMGADLAGDGEELAAAYAYRIGLLAHPGEPRLQAAFEEARARVRR